MRFFTAIISFVFCELSGNTRFNTRFDIRLDIKLDIKLDMRFISIIHHLGMWKTKLRLNGQVRIIEINKKKSFAALAAGQLMVKSPITPTYDNKRGKTHHLEF
jgi:hypothetical protein